MSEIGAPLIFAMHEMKNKKNVLRIFRQRKNGIFHKNLKIMILNCENVKGKDKKKNGTHGANNAQSFHECFYEKSMSSYKWKALQLNASLCVYRCNWGKSDSDCDVTRASFEPWANEQIHIYTHKIQRTTGDPFDVIQMHEWNREMERLHEWA